MSEGAAKSADKSLQRINSGTGHWYKINGQKADGVSWILAGSMPKNALVGWAAGAVAETVYDDTDNVVQMKKILGRDGFVKAMKEVPSRDRDQAANKGTAVHKMAEQAARGEEVEVPDYLAGHFDSYLDCRQALRPSKEMIEVSVFNLKYKYGGTLDTWAHFEGLKDFTDEHGAPLCTCDHECLTLADIKTNRSGPFGETGLQLALYGFSDVFIDANGQIRDMPAFDHYGVIWLRSDGYEYVPFDVTPKDFRTALYAQQVAHFTDWKTGRVSTIKKPAATPPAIKSKTA